MKTQAIVPMAGTGARFQASLPIVINIPKTLMRINGKPLFVHALEALQASALIDNIILVVPAAYCDEFKDFAREYQLTKVSQVIAGGVTRADSVFHGLRQLADDTDLVLIHDGVRPLITVELIERAVALGKKYPAVITAVPVKPTIKQVDKQNMLVQQTLDRDALWEVQTPQVFRKEIILKAHEQFGKKSQATDDAMLVEQLGIPVKVLKGDYRNVKVTTQEDLIFVEALLSMKEAK